MQPYFFPYIGYFQLINAVDLFVIYDDVNYINKGYINRNAILLNGHAHKITLSLLGASQNKLINEISIANNSVKILKTIESAYKKVPGFAEIFPILSSILLHQEKNLAKFMGNSLQIISDYLGLKTAFLYSSEIKKNLMLKAEFKILDICKNLGISTYINAIGGRSLYNKTAFNEQNLNLFFLKPQPGHYKQFDNEFVPNLSIIDILMFNTKLQTKKMLSQYALVE